MNKLLLFGVCLLLSITSLTSYAIERTVTQLKVEKLFQSSEEPTAKDALWTAKNIFKVAVFDDGSSRNGYAQYVCGVLNERGFHKTWVQIIDVIKLTEIGRAHV